MARDKIGFDLVVSALINYYAECPLCNAVRKGAKENGYFTFTCPDCGFTEELKFTQSIRKVNHERN